MFQSMIDKPAGNKKTTNWIVEMLDKNPDEIIVMDKKKCQILFANHVARLRCGKSDTSFPCKFRYSAYYKDLCNKCPLNNKNTIPASNYIFYIEDNDGIEYEVKTADVLWEGKTEAVALFIVNIAEERKNVKQLEYYAFMDPLTGVPNRRRFLEDMKAKLSDIEQGNLTGMVCLLDLDNFKTINDSYGHNTGDLMLKEFAKYVKWETNSYAQFYRIGGDEFVLLFMREKNGVPISVQEYEKVLSRVFKSYSLPSIEGSCTVSMGISIFPEHGRDTSELLRKADIALYKSKMLGKDQYVIFEDLFDTAKKFVDVYINMIPIFNAMNKTIGYQLKQSSLKSDMGQMQMFGFNAALDTLGVEDLNSPVKYFIPFSEHIYNPWVLENIAGSNFVFEIDDTVAQSESFIEKCRELFSRGAVIALENFNPDKFARELIDIAQILKVDLKALNSQVIRDIPRLYAGKTLIATNVDTRNQFMNMTKLGYKLFEGYYFSEAIITKAKDIEPLKANMVELLHTSSRSGVMDFKGISKTIQSDVALSFKLLKLLNSPALGLRHKITSIDFALVCLGEEELRKWITLLAVRAMTDDKPLEVIRFSLIRAAFAEGLASLMTPKRNSNSMFLLGLFSLLDVALNMSFEEIFKQINIDENISASLITQDGAFSDVVRFFKNYECGNWDFVINFALSNQLSTQDISEKYLSAVQWYNNLIKTME